MSCFIAQLSKSSQQDPDSFAHDFMMRLTDEQPELMACLAAMVQPMIDFGEREEIDTAMASEMCVLSVFCVLGVVMESISATIDAEEMNDAWS
tara:strand:+ start:545 stop:823 length:279 start_codon:yes stop_codon:yes gene_type:complete